MTTDAVQCLSNHSMVGKGGNEGTSSENGLPRMPRATELELTVFIHGKSRKNIWFFILLVWAGAGLTFGKASSC